MAPGMPPRRMPPPPQPQAPPPPAPPYDRSAQASGGGTLVIRVQPAGAEILIDGERWTGSAGDERLLVQVGEGSHHVEIHKDGYRRFTTDVVVRRGESAPLNVSLSPQE